MRIIFDPKKCLFLRKNQFFNCCLHRFLCRLFRNKCRVHTFLSSLHRFLNCPYCLFSLNLLEVTATARSASDCSTLFSFHWLLDVTNHLKNFFFFNYIVQQRKCIFCQFYFANILPRYLKNKMKNVCCLTLYIINDQYPSHLLKIKYRSKMCL